MNKVESDVLASVYLLSAEEGGRRSPIVSASFGCVFEHAGEANECRLLLGGKGEVWPGQTISVRIKFLFPELVRPRLHLGDTFELREGKVIGRGTIDEIVCR